jgi:hypothetical protein
VRKCPLTTLIGSLNRLLVLQYGIQFIFFATLDAPYDCGI